MPRTNPALSALNGLWIFHKPLPFLYFRQIKSRCLRPTAAKYPIFKAFRIRFPSSTYPISPLESKIGYQFQLFVRGENRDQNQAHRGQADGVVPPRLGPESDGRAASVLPR